MSSNIPCQTLLRKYFIQVETNLCACDFLPDTIEAASHDEAITKAARINLGQILHVWSSFQNKQPLARDDLYKFD